MPDLSNFELILGAALIGGIALLLLMIWRRLAQWAKPQLPPEPRQWIVIDGSNVMYWKNGEPQFDSVLDVLALLRAEGFTPGVMFDANAGYLLSGKYMHDKALGQRLGLKEDHVMVVPKGTPADPWILTAARDLGARIVTNDRFRDWAEIHPEVLTPGQLIRGGYDEGKLWLDLRRGDLAT